MVKVDGESLCRSCDPYEVEAATTTTDPGTPLQRSAALEELL
jgi:hypothetical protein